MKNWKNLFGRNLGLLLAAAFFTLVDCIPLQAQNVTIRPSNGSTLAARPKGDYDIFFQSGGFATWKHNQLTLTMTTSDQTGLTANGQLANPANNIFQNKTTDKISLAKGESTYKVNYIAICLPKGYRFTGYSITFSRTETKIGTGTGAYNAGQNGTVTFGETNETFSTYKTSAGATFGATNRKIERTSMSETDMSNVLYFKMENAVDERDIITLDHIELQFTSESNYTPVTPAGNINGVSAVDIPFSTSKVDYGRLSNEEYHGYAARMSYSSANVTDLEAYLTLFEEESTKDVSDNGYDGTPGKMVDYKSGTIYNEGDYFRLGREDKEQIYYLETPIYVTLPDAQKTKSPIGYRIVGAEFEYKNGTYYPEFYITYTSSGTTYYLQSTTHTVGIYPTYTTCNVTTNKSQAAKWFIDDEGYVRTGTNGSIYLRAGDSGYATTTTSKSQATKCQQTGTGLSYKSGNTTNTLRFTSVFTSEVFRFQNNTGNAAVIINSNTNSSVIKKSYDFTINVYDKTGKSLHESQTVNSTNKTGKIVISDLNNDAVKFGVEGIGLVKATLTLQALDPYIDRLDIVCQEQDGNGRKLTQQFNATDFSVRGGKFNFYVPEDYVFPCRFTFEELYSKYGDNTYYNNTGSTSHSRYSFVWSPYFEYIGTHGQNVYYTDPDHTYTDKVKTDYAGLTEYKFNNAADFVDGGNGGIYTEYPFTPAKYGDGQDGRPKNFKEFIFSQEEMNSGESKTAYLFTSDETRYNIAPTTATQHVYYAYYQMEISMQKRTYKPELKWTKIYDDGKTLYMGNNGGPATDSQWGLELSTSDAGDQGEIGYLSVSQVVNGINNAINNEGAPKAKDQILYVDGSKLLSLVEDQTKDESNNMVTHTLNQIKEGLGANVIVYLPKGVSAKYDNFAMNTDAGFRGAGNFVITDRKPFYAPYDIQIDAANYCTYQRELEVEQNGDVKLAKGSIILPFVLSVDENGYHVNVDGTKPFSVHEMQSTNCIGPKDEQDDTQNVYFPAINGVTATKANTPYIIKIDDVEDQVVELPFVATQKGTRIIATTTGMDKDNYTFAGMLATGTTTPTAKTPEAATYNFQSLGTYAGAKLSIEDETNYFYFSHNYLVCTKNLDKDLEYAYILPFRTYYPTTTKKVATFGVIFGEGEGNTDPTGISNVDETPDLVVAPGVGTITMASTIEQGVKIYNMSGVLVDKVVMGAGETKTVNLPAGMYIVNDAKLIVR